MEKIHNMSIGMSRWCSFHLLFRLASSLSSPLLFCWTLRARPKGHFLLLQRQNVFNVVRALIPSSITILMLDEGNCKYFIFIHTCRWQRTEFRLREASKNIIKVTREHHYSIQQSTSFHRRRRRMATILLFLRVNLTYECIHVISYEREKILKCAR